MNAVQSSLFPGAQDELQNAIYRVKNYGFGHAEYETFVRALVVAYKSSNPGETTVAGCAGGVTVDEVIGGFGKTLKKFETDNNHRLSPLKAVRIDAPSCFTRKQFEEELFARYYLALNTVPLGHKGQPRYSDDSATDLFDHLAGLRAQTPLGRLVAVLKTKRPSLIIIQEAENLGWSNATWDEKRTAWKLLVDIARQSGIPHIVFAPIATVKDVLQDDEALRSLVRIEILQPYLSADRKDGESLAYRHALAHFNQPLPWGKRDSLVNHIGEIDHCIHGDIARLRQWIVRAASRALSDPETTCVSWAHFYQTQPTVEQVRLASEDKKAAIIFRGPELPKAAEDEAPSPSAKDEPKEPEVPPGKRKSTRDKKRPLNLPEP